MNNDVARAEVRKIAVFRALHLGDLLCAVPALRALRATYPKAQITLVGLPWARSFAARLSYVDQFLEFPGFPGIKERPFDVQAADLFFDLVRRTRFDVAIQMHGDGRISNRFVRLLGAATTVGYCPSRRGSCGLTVSAPYPVGVHEIHRCLGLVKLLGGEADDDRLEFPITATDRAEAEQLLANGALSGEGPLVGLHAGANAEDKRWPLYRFAGVGDYLHRRYGAKLLLTGVDSERGLVTALQRILRAPGLNLAGMTSLGGLAAIVDRLDLLITNDSGPSHLAVALNTPSIVVFGATDPRRWAPLDTVGHVAIARRPPWASAMDDEHMRRLRLQQITVEEVCEAAGALLKRWPVQFGREDRRREEVSRVFWKDASDDSPLAGS